MKILVTGGAGFIGTHLCKRLLAEGHEVSILDNLSPQVHGKAGRPETRGAKLAVGDVRDVEAVAGMVKGVDIVYHLAAETGVGQSQYEIERYVSTNTLGTAVVAQEAGKAGVKHFILSSSRAVYGEGLHRCGGCSTTVVPASRQPSRLRQGKWEIPCPRCGADLEALPMSVGDPPSPISIYGMTKLQQEEIAQQVSKIFPIRTTSLRLFNVFGPGQSLSNPYVGVLGTFFRQISAGLGVDIYEDGKMRRDFVYIDEVIDALARPLADHEAAGGTYNVASGVPITLLDAARAMFRALDAEPKLAVSGKFRIGDIHHAVGETEATASTLGISARTSFPDGLRQYVAWARQQEPQDPSIDAAAEKLLLENDCLAQANGSL